ncbi:MAG: alpha/beta hydrolase [Proteobacteria bacterium]|jgi:pimeloyl-ACP methyl ester carboxylesterase|nr:alpha/beta hydrolase [Pseudomonadota bacterium]
MASYLSQFNYQLYGPEQGRKWVFLHGLMGYGLNWRKIATSLASTERVLTFDQRGHGQSLKPLTGYAPEDYADDLALILEELGWTQVILVGHSMGGRNAIMFAHKFPEKVERLVIEDIGPDSRPDAPEYYRTLLGLVPTPFKNKLRAKEFFMNEFPVLARNYDQPQTLGSYFYSNIIERADGTADWRFSKEAMIMTVVQGRAQDHWKELRALPMPTLVIRGENSKDLTREVFQRMALSNPMIQGKEVAQSGHWVHYDQPEVFIKLLKEFTGIGPIE